MGVGGREAASSHQPMVLRAKGAIALMAEPGNRQYASNKLANDFLNIACE